MLITQSRVWADSVEQAVDKIRLKHPSGTLTVRETHISGWWEYAIVEEYPNATTADSNR